MTAFWVAAGGLLVLCALLLKVPRMRSTDADDDLAQVNVQWFRRREQELAEQGDEALLADARIRLLEDEQVTVASGRAGGRSLPQWWLLPFVALFVAAVYYQLGGARDVVIAEQLANLETAADAADFEALLVSIERRAQQRPDNLHYAALLGRFYMGQQDYVRAEQVYAALVEKAPGDAQAMAYAAQASYLAGGRKLTERAQMLAEQALAADPAQRTALGLLGMAAFEQQQYRPAIAYWQRLLDLETPGTEGYQMISSVLATAREQLGEGTQPPEAVGPGVELTISLPTDVEVAPQAVVFVFARSATSESRMPIAARRLAASELPVTLRLDDSHSMAGQILSQAGEVMLYAQLSADGQPGEANASWLAQAGPVTAADEAPSVHLQLAPKP
jgi:cytochrome c-type biogenesis protein CcmH